MSISDKIFYNESSSKSLGWDPSWLGLKDFDDNDHLLMMGDPAAMGIACCIAAEMNRGKFKILKWDKMQKRYYSVQVNLNEKGEIDEQDKL